MGIWRSHYSKNHCQPYQMKDNIPIKFKTKENPSHIPHLRTVIPRANVLILHFRIALSSTWPFEALQLSTSIQLWATRKITSFTRKIQTAQMGVLVVVVKKKKKTQLEMVNIVVPCVWDCFVSFFFSFVYTRFGKHDIWRATWNARKAGH